MVRSTSAAAQPEAEDRGNETQPTCKGKVVPLSPRCVQAMEQPELSEEELVPVLQLLLM